MPCGCEDDTGSLLQICEVTCTSQKDFQTHLNGDRHRGNATVTPVLAAVTDSSADIDKVEDACNNADNHHDSSSNDKPGLDHSNKTVAEARASLSGTKQSHKKPVARIQILLNQCTHPLIGLNYINEYQRRDSLQDSWYHCELCSCRLDRKSIIGHIVSFKHRESYLVGSE